MRFWEFNVNEYSTQIQLGYVTSADYPFSRKALLSPTAARITWSMAQIYKPNQHCLTFFSTVGGGGYQKRAIVFAPVPLNKIIQFFRSSDFFLEIPARIVFFLTLKKSEQNNLVRNLFLSFFKGGGSLPESSDLFWHTKDPSKIVWSFFRSSIFWPLFWRSLSSEYTWSRLSIRYNSLISVSWIWNDFYFSKVRRHTTVLIFLF